MSKKKNRRSSQGEFRFVGHGGKRRGSGRKRKSRRGGSTHRPAKRLEREFAAHVTIRLDASLPNLRDAAMFEVVLFALTASAFGLFFRIVEYSVQRNHLHLIIEATDSISMTAGMRATGVRLASSINHKLDRIGPVIGDRFHWRPLSSPRDARNA